MGHKQMADSFRIPASCPGWIRLIEKGSFMILKRLRLKNKADRRLKLGHCGYTVMK